MKFYLCVLVALGFGLVVINHRAQVAAHEPKSDEFSDDALVRISMTSSTLENNGFRSGDPFTRRDGKVAMWLTKRGVDVLCVDDMIERCYVRRGDQYRFEF